MRRSPAPSTLTANTSTCTASPSIRTCPGWRFSACSTGIGPLLPVLELQARWVAYAWSGARPLPGEDQMRAASTRPGAVANCRRSCRCTPRRVTFAAAAGLDPDIAAWPGLARALLFGPLTPSSFRLSGRDALPDAARARRPRRRGVRRDHLAPADGRRVREAPGTRRREPGFRLRGAGRAAHGVEVVASSFQLPLPRFSLPAWMSKFQVPSPRTPNRPTRPAPGAQRRVPSTNRSQSPSPEPRVPRQ